MDALLKWVEGQEEFIDDTNVHHSAPMIDKAPSIKEVSRQLWAMMSPLVKESAIASTFANVPRLNGLEAWRRIAEPVNDDKLLLQKELLTRVTNPKLAASSEGIEKAFQDWDTSIRLFSKAGGTEPDDALRRMTLLQTPPD